MNFEECGGCPFWVSMTALKKREEYHCIKGRDGWCKKTNSTKNH